MSGGYVSGKYENNYLPDGSGVYTPPPIPFGISGLDRFRIVVLKNKIHIMCVPCGNFPITCPRFSADLTEVLDELTQHRCRP